MKKIKSYILTLIYIFLVSLIIIFIGTAGSSSSDFSYHLGYVFGGIIFWYIIFKIAIWDNERRRKLLPKWRKEQDEYEKEERREERKESRREKQKAIEYRLNKQSIDKKENEEFIQFIKWIGIAIGIIILGITIKYIFF